MIITKKAIPRRTVLRGMGATLALPFLDAMVPALTGAPKPVQRFGAVYVPNGIMMPYWTPSTEGAGFEFSQILQPLAPYRDQVLVLSGLNSTLPATFDPEVGGAIHARATTRFLTDVHPRAGIRAGTSTDQLAARVIGKGTQLGSLELGVDSVNDGVTGSCDGGSCVFNGTISWSSPTTPLPMDNDPRGVFERLFGDAESTDPRVRQERINEKRSILDSVISKANALAARVGVADRLRLGGFLEAVRDVERRIANAEEQNAQLPVVAQPDAIPGKYGDHARLMFDLQHLGFQADLTRVTTFMLAREQGGRSYSEIGVPDAHHPISHHRNDPDLILRNAKINTYHVDLFAYFLDKLKNTPEGDGTLLDSIMIQYGAGMSDPNVHDPLHLPILVVGGGGGQLKGGRHLRYPDGTPLANLHLALLDKLGVHDVDRIGDSTGELGYLSDV